MARPVFLVIEVEQPDGLSTRKLVLETAKHNVLTAHSGKEGIEIARKHPLDAVVIHHGIRDVAPEKIAGEMKKTQPSIPVVLLMPNGVPRSKAVDHVVGSHEPHALLQVLENIAGIPADKPH